MNARILFALLLGMVILSACGSPAQELPTPTPLVFPTLNFMITETATPQVAPSTPVGIITEVGAATALPAVTPSGPTASGNANICADPQVTALIDALKKAVTSADGTLLASLVSPASGMDVRFFRNGTVVNYDQQHAKFLFETTYSVDWGAEPGSGAMKSGSFHDVIVPDLVKSFNQPYSLVCNELKHGGASYNIEWPYQKDFYSIYFPGTEANGNLDWHTWVAGIEYVNGKPYLYALTPYFWEP